MRASAVEKSKHFKKKKRFYKGFFPTPNCPTLIRQQQHSNDIFEIGVLCFALLFMSLQAKC
jgi:hypothetical protein